MEGWRCLFDGWAGLFDRWANLCFAQNRPSYVLSHVGWAICPSSPHVTAVSHVGWAICPSSPMLPPYPT